MRLKTRTILITRSARQSPEFRELLKAEGARVLEAPAIEIRPRPSTAISEAVEPLEDYHWVIFTSSNAVVAFCNALQPTTLKAWRSRGQAPRACAVGPATARALEQREFPAALIPEQFRAEGVVAALRKDEGPALEGLRVLFPAASGARQVIPEQLRRLGALVDFVPVYDTVAPADGEARLREALAQGPDMITFTSPSTVENFVKMAGEDWEPGAFLYAAIGPVTTQRAQAKDLTITVQPPQSTIPALVEAIAQFFQGRDPL